MGKALFITGTGTDVGKTYVTGLIVKCLREAGLSASYYKAALSGAETAKDGSLLPGDALYVRRIAGLMEPADELVSYVYRDAVSRQKSSIAPWILTRWRAIFSGQRRAQTI